MSKEVKVVVETTVVVPDYAEIVRFIDADGVDTSCVKVAGRLALPAIHWFEYITADASGRARAGNGHDGEMRPRPISMVELPGDFCDENLRQWEFARYELKEVQGPEGHSAS